MPRDAWLAMVKGRFWSTFSHSDDEELERGIAEIVARYPCVPCKECAERGGNVESGGASGASPDREGCRCGVLEFVDKLLFVTAVRT